MQDRETVLSLVGRPWPQLRVIWSRILGAGRGQLLLDAASIHRPSQFAGAIGLSVSAQPRTLILWHLFVYC